MSSECYVDEEDCAASGRLWMWISFGLSLVFIGIAILFVVSMLSGGVGNGSVGGVIFIGPIPIVFGAGPEMLWLIAISVAISIISIIAFVIMSRRVRRE